MVGFSLPDNSSLRGNHNVPLRRTSTIWLSLFAGHKADRFFGGNRVILQQSPSPDDPDDPLRQHLLSGDHLFPYHSELWLRQNGSIPTRS